MKEQINGENFGETKKRRHLRRIHYGVRLVKRRVKKTGYEYWSARWEDPYSGRTTECTLDPIAVPSHGARRQWAAQKAAVLAKQRAELASGAPRKTDTPVSEAIENYLEAASNRLRPRTIEVYQVAAKAFLEWSESNGLKRIEDLTAGRLAAFRDNCIARRRLYSVRGGKRGERKRAKSNRSPASINVELRAIRTMVFQWRTEERLPHIDRETIGRALKVLPVPRKAPAYLPPIACRKLLEAAIRHDNKTFSKTRDEHYRLKPLGSTPRYPAIAPFVAFLLLSGCRLSEGLNLRWSDIDLDALDSEGRKVGEILLRETSTKTKQWRTIGLEVSPLLRTLLASMKLRAGADIYVFGGKKPLSKHSVEAARKRLVGTCEAPGFSWQNLRQTTGTFLTNAPGIYGAASVFMSARQLGHSVTVAEKHYLGVLRGIPRDARTLEQAMQIKEQMQQVVDGV